MLQVFFELLGGCASVFCLSVARFFAACFASVETRGAEEDDRVLNLFAAEARQRFLIFRQDSKDASVGAVEERFVLIGDAARI